MTFRDFIWKNIKSNLRKYSMFMGSITIAMMVFFMFSTVWLNKGFKEVKTSQINTLFAVAGTLVIVYSLFLILYTHSLFIKSRGREFSVLISYGLSLKDLTRMICLESMLIYVFCFLVALLSGTILSRLFFMVSIKILDVESIKYTLTPESFLVTLLVFTPICLMTLLVSRVRIQKMKVIQLKNMNEEIEMRSEGRFFLFILGLIFILGSIWLTNVYTSHVLSEDIMNPKMIGLILLCLLGVILLNSHLSAFLIKLWKNEKSSQFYYFVENSSFVTDFKKNKRLMHMTTLLSFGIVLFVSVTFTLMNESYKLAEKESFFDLEYQELESFPYGDKLSVEGLAERLALTGQVEEEIVDFVYVYSPNLILLTWRTKQYVPVMSVKEYNQLMDQNIQVSPSHCVEINFESEISDVVGYYNETVIFEQNNQEINYPIDATIREKVFSRYLFPQSVLILVNEDDYQLLLSHAGQDEIGRLHLAQIEDWVHQKEYSDTFLEMYRGVWMLWEESPEWMNEMVEKYDYSILNYRDKYRSYIHSKELGAFSLYIMAFISILFVFAITVTFYFNIYSGWFKDKQMLLKLKGIGLSEGEGKRMIARKIGRTIYWPVFLGSVIGILMCYSLNFHRMLEMEITSYTFMMNGVWVSILYWIYIGFIYQVLKRQYYRLVK